jgi:hypothetical protein
VKPEALRGVVEVGLRLAGAEGLTPGASSDGRSVFALPEMDRSWQGTLDTLRPRRARDETFWDWRKKAPKPITFDPIQRLTDEVEQLHLAHPFVRRILDRFLAQGYGAHDLSRVAGVVVPGQNVARVIAYGRLSLFGHGAARLHDEILAVAAPWPEDPAQAEPYKDSATAANARAVTEAALAAGAAALPAPVERKVLAATGTLFSALWPHLEELADAKDAEARTGLGRRARKESDELRALLERQRGAIKDALDTLRQVTLPEIGDKAQQRQVELDIGHLTDRTHRIGAELESEPAAIEALYAVRMSRRTPLGLVVAWPEAMT